MVKTPDIENTMVRKLYVTFLHHTHVCMWSLFTGTTYSFLHFTFIILISPNDIPLSNLFVTYVIACILIRLPSCWKFYQVGCHQGQHISHNSNTNMFMGVSVLVIAYTTMYSMSVIYQFGKSYTFPCTCLCIFSSLDNSIYLLLWLYSYPFQNAQPSHYYETLW